MHSSATLLVLTEGALDAFFVGVANGEKAEAEVARRAMAEINFIVIRCLSLTGLLKYERNYSFSLVHCAMPWPS